MTTETIDIITTDVATHYMHGRATVSQEVYAWTATRTGESWAVGVIQVGQPGLLKGLAATRTGIEPKVIELIRAKRAGSLTPTLI